METLKEIFQSLIDGYKERTKSPLIGSFMISFFFFNWKHFAILFYSQWAMHCRIEWIEQNYEISKNFFIPLAFALFYVLVLPYINLFFEYCLKKYSEFKIKKTNTLKIDKLKQKVLEAKEQRNIADAKAGTSELNDLNERNKALIQENKKLIEQNKEDLDRHNSIMDQFKARDTEYKNEINLLNNELNNVKDSIRYEKLGKSYPDEKDKVIEADKQLSIDDKIDFYNHFSEGNKNNKVFSDGLTRKLLKLRLIGMGHSADTQFILTNYGDAFMFLLQETGYDLF